MTTHPLTPRQLEACALYAQGLRVYKVAQRMGVKPSVAQHYLDDARRRMDARTLGQLMFMLGREVRL